MKMVEAEVAWDMVAAQVKSLSVPREDRPLVACTGSYLLEPICADRDLPPTDRSAMDGYALVCPPAAGVTEFRRIGEVAAGEAATAAPGPGECVRIFTGAAVPAPANTVIRQEDTTVAGADLVRVEPTALRKGVNIRRQGEEARAGDVLVPAGQRIGAAVTAVAAMVGRATLPVRRALRVAVLTTGNELKAVDAAVAPHEIRDSNGPMLVAALRAVPCEVGTCRRVEDTPEAVQQALWDGRAEHDVLILTGGVSVGDYDYVPDAIAAVGGVIHFRGVAMKPGKPQLFAMLPGGRPVFGLPGNPVSALLGMHELVLPALRLMSGCPAAAARPELRLPLKADVRGLTDKVRYIPARCVEGGVEPLSGKGSADIAATIRADGFIMLPARTGVVPVGTTVRFRPWSASI